MEFIQFLLLAIILFVLSGIKIINQYERGVVLTLGKFTGLRQPGLRIVVPIFQKLIRVDVRSTPIDVYATSQFAQAALRDVTGNVDMDDLLAKREEISQQIKQIVDAETDKWGIDVENVKIQNIELPQDMKRAMAKQAEAERERRAVIITADGEKAAAQAVADAATMLSKVPGGINIRTLQTLEKIAVEPSQKTLVVLPTELTHIKDILK